MEKLNCAPKISICFLFDIIDLKLIYSNITLVAFFRIHNLMQDFIDLFICRLIYGKLFYDSLLPEILIQSWREKLAQKLFGLFIWITESEN